MLLLHRSWRGVAHRLLKAPTSHQVENSKDLDILKVPHVQNQSLWIYRKYVYSSLMFCCFWCCFLLFLFKKQKVIEIYFKVELDMMLHFCIQVRLTSNTYSILSLLHSGLQSSLTKNWGEGTFSISCLRSPIRKNIELLFLRCIWRSY